jgi:hypothetical protein
MKPLICPQCGGKVTEYEAWQNFARCGYCETEFIITPESKNDEKSVIESAFRFAGSTVLILSTVCVLIFVGSIFLIVSLTKSKESSPTSSATPNAPKAKSETSPKSKPDTDLLVFGGEGTGEGLFYNAAKIAFDANGNIYVGDESLRVQRFDPEGKFLKLWQIPSSTEKYKRARTIRKIAVDESERLYVLVGGVILVYEQEETEPSRTISFAPQPIQDFALRADDTILAIINFGNIEVLEHLTREGKTLRRVKGFHSEAAQAAISPYSTGIASIRLAVDGAGNIFSVFALADLGTYQISFDPDDFQILRFTPEGKYVNKFYQTMNSRGIAVDSQSRIYISDRDKIIVLSSKDGTRLGITSSFGSIRSFALDKQDFIYVVTSDNRVIKRAPPV